jgi:hypothetical protein
MKMYDQSSGKELSRLDYSNPICWCEIIGHYTNPTGQEFELRVRGTNPEVVNEYVQAVLVSFEVLPVREDASQQQESAQQEDEKYQNIVDEEFKNIDLHPELDLEIDFEVINSQGIEPPYVLNTVIDPPISRGATHNYHTKQNTRSVKVTLNATVNGVSGVLTGDGRKQADTYKPDPPKPTAVFSGSANSAVKFTFSVTGIKEKNKYTYKSSVALERE